MIPVQSKPKLAYFQYLYDPRLPEFLLVHTREHVRCLSEFFEVRVINYDCDFRQICDEFEPDMALFEGGVPFATCKRPKVGNLSACPDVPKAGLLNSDSFCEARAGFISDMQHRGIETFFAIATTAAEYTPAIAENIFVWPNFVDPSVYRDYGQWKSIPVLFTGNQSSLYPWRQKIAKLITQHYPSLICPHPGYSPQKLTKQIMLGERYARTINSASFVPACGTVANEIIRKHFEVPACRSCLITEKSASLEAAGFRDMRNCVFADEGDILDKLSHLFAHPDDLERITDEGYKLVQSRHTLYQRNQILAWLELKKNLQPGEKIVQPNPFEPLQKANKSVPAFHIETNGLLISLLREGDRKLAQRNYREAETFYLKCVNYYRFMPEPHIRLAICRLHQGDAGSALSRVMKLIRFLLDDYKSVDPDPVEWAYLVRTLLCLGKVDEAFERSLEFTWLHNPELDRARWAARVLKNQEPASIELSAAPYRPSIHQLPVVEHQAWVEELCDMLRACKQPHLAAVLTRYAVVRPALSADACPPEGQALSQGKSPAVSLTPSNTRALVPARLYSDLKQRAKRVAKDFLHRLERRFGYFLPYHLSQARHDDFYGAIHSAACNETIQSALLIGAKSRRGSAAAALLTGLKENRVRPFAVCIREHGAEIEGDPYYRHAKWYTVRDSAPGQLAQKLKEIKTTSNISAFDLVILESPERNVEIGDELEGARKIFLEGINRTLGEQRYSLLLADDRYALVDVNPGLRDGYAIFEQKEAVRAFSEQSLECSHQ